MRTYLLLGLLFFAATHSIAQRPVNPQATREARQLLKYLYQVSGKNTLSGHHNYNGQQSRYTERAHEITGEWPAVWGSDLNLLSGYVRQNVIDEAIRAHEQGSIITLMWHAERPLDTFPVGFREDVQGEITPEAWQNLLTPGTAEHTAWLFQVDSIAFYLKQLQDRRIPVLWRPYHEMNGQWFWWGDQRGENGFTALWKMMYDRLVNYHQVHNLVWVWNANAPRDKENDTAYAYHFYYPGNEWVDVLAADVYHNDYKQSHHDELLELGGGKVIALGEVGEMPTPEILAAQPRWAWFMVWTSWVDTHNTPEQVRALYADPKVLNREEIRRAWVKKKK